MQEATVKRAEPAGGATIKLTRKAGQDLVFGDTDTVGLYEASWGERHPYRFTVNMFDPEESNIAVHSEVQIGYESVKAERAPVKRRGSCGRGLPGWLGVLILEWLLYLRRIRV